MDLHAEYAGAVNVAVAEDREELIDELVDQFSAAALQLMTSRDRAA